MMTALGALCLVGAVHAATLVEEFDGPGLDLDTWNPCQADADRLLFFERETAGGTRTFLVNRIDPRRDNENCYRKMLHALLIGSLNLDIGADLGDSLVPSTAGDHCTFPETRDGEPRVQRNELRLRDPRHLHDLDEAHYYQFVFRYRDGHGIAPFPDCGSSRWVNAQWKYNDATRPAGIDESPFLAQRMDNGVFHVTIQNGHCRCMIAKAEGDPHRRRAGMPSPLAAFLPGDTLRRIRPLSCEWSASVIPARDSVCSPSALSVHAFSDNGEPPPLPDPRRGWVNMLYHVQGGRDGRIDVYANGRFIVRAEGFIGYPGDHPGRVKFKFGTYRDRIPGAAELLVDRICLSTDAADCDATVHLVPAGEPGH